jgi:hypothetical protein
MPDDEERIAGLLGALPPAPAGWVAAAVELPLARRALAGIERQFAGEQAREAQTARLEEALALAGYEPTPALVRAVRRELQRPAD